MNSTIRNLLENYRTQNDNSAERLTRLFWDIRYELALQELKDIRDNGGVRQTTRED